MWWKLNIYIYYIIYIVACISEGHLAFPKPSKLPILRMRKGQPPTPVINMVRMKTPCQILSVCGYCLLVGSADERVLTCFGQCCASSGRERKSERDRERGKTKTRNMTYFSSTSLLSMKCYAEAGKFAALARPSWDPDAWCTDSILKAEETVSRWCNTAPIATFMPSTPRERKKERVDTKDLVVQWTHQFSKQPQVGLPA